MLAIIYTILIFGVLIFVHELGHFLAARLSGVTVLEFAIGMGPAIFKKQGKKTLYSIRLLPIGGYCSMEGETEESDAPGAFKKASKPRRAIILAAGVTMNFLVGFLLMLTTFIGTEVYSTKTIAEFNTADALSNQTGLMVNDTVQKVNGTTIFTANDIVFALLRDDDGIVEMDVLRDGKTVHLSDVEFKVSGEGENRTLDLDFKVYGEKASFLGAFSQALDGTISLVRNTWVSLGDMVTGRVGISELSGPVGVGEVVSQAAQIGWQSVIMIAAFLSISLGIFNLLPIPALDGGHLLLLLIEAIRGKPLNQKLEGILTVIGFAFFILLFIVVTISDVIKLF